MIVYTGKGKIWPQLTVPCVQQYYRPYESTVQSYTYIQVHITLFPSNPGGSLPGPCPQLTCTLVQDRLCAPSTALPDLGTGPRSLLTLPEHLEGKWCDSGWSGAGGVNKHCFCQGSAACGHPVLCLPSLQHSAWGSGHIFCFRALLFPFEGIPHMLISHQGSECLQSALWD